MGDPKRFTLDFSEITLKDLPEVGGKNASLGELYNSLKQKKINVLDGFATTADAFRYFIDEAEIEEELRAILSGFDVSDTKQLQIRGFAARNAILEAYIPDDLREAILLAYEGLCERIGREAELAVRSSATAEDLPEASFAGAAETFLNVRGRESLMIAIQHCFASLFTDRAINYRAQVGFDQLEIALSVGVQPMVRSDLATAGVIFTLDTESGFRDVVGISSSYGLGESVVQGVVTPDEWTIFKPTLMDGKNAIIGRRLGTKEIKLAYTDGTKATRNLPVAKADRQTFSLTDDEVLKLARWACVIEEHYSKLAGHAQPLDLEWAKDGISGELFIVQARPETVHSAKPKANFIETYKLKGRLRKPLVTGQAVGEKIGTGRVRRALDTGDLLRIEPGDILVARHTNPDWEPVMKRVAAIVTDHGGRTAHAAIVSRELGLPCIVGCGNATEVLKDGDEVTVSCSEGSEGRVYPGHIEYEIEKTDFANLPETQTKVMFNIADPENAFSIAALPNDGVGLARIEFIINHMGIHPMAFARLAELENGQEKYAIEKKLARQGETDPKEFFIRGLAESVGKIAAAFYPKPVIVRTSDFKTNEYGKLLGGSEFEPTEENPMLGFRGASRYTDTRYQEGFALECAALKRVRTDMGLTNLKVMIPFCRTVNEARAVIDEMAKNGLKQGENDLEIYVMCELPSNVVRAKDFLEIFDGYSIGSNDLTQLVLGIDRDSGTVAELFDEENDAVKDMISAAIKAANESGKPIGICGQAPSDKPEFAAWLVEQGITSISLTPDTAAKTTFVIADAETPKQERSAGTN
ncbi:MAG: phosphoenolpyruvate synthase [Pyrinomonadaceae bacterium]|nr:phosphoenolpyruvate synthase [Pyrinomonadaceae bacterium]